MNKCLCDNSQHGDSQDPVLDGCSILTDVEFCEWCAKGCQKRKSKR